MVGRHAGTHERRHHGATARYGTYGDSFAYAFSHQVERGVGDSGRACIAHEGDVAFVLEVFHVARSHLLLVEVVVGFHGRGDSVGVKQHAAVARVLGEHERDFLENPHGPVGDIFHVPDGSRDYI